MSPTSSTLTEREQREVDEANASGLPTVVFVHGLWLLAGSWDGWRELFAQRGYATVAPGWPDDPPSVADGRAHPEVFAGKGVQQITDHYEDVISHLSAKPAVVGHSFGGLITQKLAASGLASSSVAVSPAPGRGVLPLPASALRSSFPVLKNPANRKRAVMLSFEQFRYAFVNAVEESEARELYERYPVPGAGGPLFQAAAANFNPRSETRVDVANPHRGPMKFISGEHDHTVPRAITNAAYKRQRKNEGVTEFEEIAGRGHSLVFDSGWRSVAETALAFIDRHRA